MSTSCVLPNTTTPVANDATMPLAGAHDILKNVEEGKYFGERYQWGQPTGKTMNLPPGKYIVRGQQYFVALEATRDTYAPSSKESYRVVSGGSAKNAAKEPTGDAAVPIDVKLAVTYTFMRRTPYTQVTAVGFRRDTGEAVLWRKCTVSGKHAEPIARNWWTREQYRFLPVEAEDIARNVWQELK